MPPALAAVLERVATEAEKQGRDGPRAVATVLLAGCTKRAEEAHAALVKARQNRSAARERVELRRAALEAVEPGDLESRFGRAERLDDAWARFEAQAALVAKAEREAAKAYRTLETASEVFGPWLSRPLLVGEPAPEGAEEWSHDPPALPPEVAELRAPMPSAKQREKLTPVSAGPLKVLRRTDGVWVVVDERLPVGGRTVYEAGPWLRQANDACRDLAHHEGIELDAAKGDA